MKFLIFILMIFCHLSCMEPQKNECYLALLPKDVQDMIARYLPFNDRETDDEFIKRALRLYKLPRPFRPLSICAEFIELCPPGHSRDGNTASYILYKSKILLIEKFFKIGFGPTPKVSIIDLKKNQKIVQTDLINIIKEKIDSLEYMTLSRDEKLIAQIVTNHLETYRTPFYYQYKLLIKNREDNLVIQEFSLPAEFDKCEFNKQGTKIIAFSKVNRDAIQHQIYQIKNENEDRIKSQKTLSEYLRHRGICKNLKNDLSL